MPHGLHLARLANGVRIVAERMPDARSVSVGVWCSVGSRHELSNEAGLAHFIEHLCFKGTERRSARQISEEIDRLGGDLNAFTTRETTTFYSTVLSEHVGRAVDLLQDLMTRPVLAPRDVVKERQVIIEEIKMVDDNPEEMVYDLHARQLWGRHPLGHPIQGTAKTVARFSRRRLREFWLHEYQPRRVVISVAGQFKWHALVQLLERTFGRWRPRPMPDRRLTSAPGVSGGIRFIRKSVAQLHCCLSTPGLSQDDPDRAVGYLLNTILGGSVSSRLFQEVRERRGLAYTVYSSLQGFADTGILSVYAACQPVVGAKVVQLIQRQMRALARESVGLRELNQTKEQLRGIVLLGLEQTSARMSRLARDLIYLDRPVPIEEGLRAIKAVTPTQIRRLAERLFVPSSYSLTLMGPSAPGLSSHAWKAE